METGNKYSSKATEATVEQNFLVKDSAVFNPEKAVTAYHLSVLIADKTVGFAVLDTTSKKYIALGQQDSTKNTLEEIFKQYGLNIAFKTVNAGIINQRSTLIPEPLFDEKELKTYLEFNHAIATHEQLGFDAVSAANAFNVYSYSEQLKNELKTLYPNIQLNHYASPLLEYCLIMNKNEKGKKFYADFYHDHFVLVAVHDGQLIFHNSFEYQAKEDIAYYLLFVMEQLKVNPAEVPLYISGEVDGEKQVISLLKQYLTKVRYSKLPTHFEYASDFSKLNTHRFFNLSCQYLCV